MCTCLMHAFQTVEHSVKTVHELMEVCDGLMVHMPAIDTLVAQM